MANTPTQRGRKEGIRAHSTLKLKLDPGMCNGVVRGKQYPVDAGELAWLRSNIM